MLHTLFSLVNTMYMPFAIIYYVQRVFVKCKHHYACEELTVSDYFTDEIIVMLIGIFVSMPFWFFVLIVLDVKKNGGRVRDVIKYFFSNVSGVYLFFIFIY